MQRQGVHLDLLDNMSADEFRRTLKEFMARRGNPSLLVSDNAKTFQSTAKWLSKIVKHPDVNNVLVKYNLSWKFDLSRSPWWGGFFERMVGLTKGVLFKSLGKARLTFKALKEVLLEVEVILNNRPLGYMEDDIQLPALTPHMIIHGTNITLPEEEDDSDAEMNEPAPARLARHLKRCKDALWTRWTPEYLRALRERHDSGKRFGCNISIGDIVLIKGEQKNRVLWNKGLVIKLIERDGIILGARLETGENKIFERSVKHLYPLEIKMDVANNNEHVQSINHDDQHQRPKRQAKDEALKKIKEIAEYEDTPTDLALLDTSV